jgi:hypothetical protein
MRANVGVPLLRRPGGRLATKRSPFSSSILERVLSLNRQMAKGIYKIGLVIALGAVMAISAFAQGRGSALMRGSSAQTRSFSGPARGFSAPGRSNGSRRGFPPIATPLNPSFAPINGVPGLGFDFPHMAAVGRGSRNRFGSFGFNGGFPSFFTPIFFDPLPLYYPFETETPDYYTQGAQAPQFLTPLPQQPIAPAPSQVAPRETATPQVPPQPPPELGQLILVRRDGQVLLAVAFTIRNGQLTYISNDGTRRSFPTSELDKDATRQMNDANGTSVSLPN